MDVREKSNKLGLQGEEYNSPFKTLGKFTAGMEISKQRRLRSQTSTAGGVEQEQSLTVLGQEANRSFETRETARSIEDACEVDDILSGRLHRLLAVQYRLPQKAEAA